MYHIVSQQNVGANEGNACASVHSTHAQRLLVMKPPSLCSALTPSFLEPGGQPLPVGPDFPCYCPRVTCRGLSQRILDFSFRVFPTL